MKQLNFRRLLTVLFAMSVATASSGNNDYRSQPGNLLCGDAADENLTGNKNQSDDIYDVGTAVVDITPNYPIRLNGFGNRREESEGISQHIFAKALAIQQSGRHDSNSAPLVLVTLDSLGIRQTMVDEVARRLMASHKLPANNLAITFTHSHCAPKVNGASDNIFSTAFPDDHQKHIDQYTATLTNDITAAAQQALNKMQPAHLDWTVGEAKFAKNRRIVGGPRDHDLPTLVVRDVKSKKLRAIYVSYACHCVTLSFNQISGDWAGYAADLIQRQNPGVMAMVSIGAGSDQNPVSGVTGDKVQVAEAQGLEIATEVQRLLKSGLKRISGAPNSVRKTIPLPLNKLPTREELVAQTGKGRPTDRYNAQTQLARLDRGEKLLEQIDYAVQTWTFGDSFCMAFLAGEVCVDYALRLKRELDRERFWLNAYSNDFCCYIPSERLVKEGGYGGGAEVPYFALPATLQGGLEQKIVDEVKRQVPKTIHVPPGTQGIAPKSPAQSLKSMKLASPRLQIKLAAAEPEVTDPVAIDFGTDGRLWVAEMNDYGRDVYESFQQTGRVRWLRDTDNDGYFETAQTFVDGLRFPTDVKVWRDGVLICDAPDILFARDTNNDGKADDVQKLFTGFEVRNAQARVNSLRFGLDGWIYGAGGLFGGKITCTKTGQIIDCSNRDFRMNPDTGEFEAITGRTQQGRCRNDWGDWFGCSNGTLLRSIPSDDRYVKRNPAHAPGIVQTIVTDAEAYKLYPPQNLVTFELSGVPGRATSACGLGIYRDVVLGNEFLNDSFTCEPVHQSVHRIDFQRGANGFTGSRGNGEKDNEFLSSSDRWFRPVQARTGPDGALWVVDMYRFVIEHSRWIPQTTLAELDVYAGQGRGRIYRVLPAADVSDATHPSRDPRPVIPNIAELNDTDLAARLDSSNGPLRDLAHQLLQWRNATTASAAIRKVLQDSTFAAGRIQALSALLTLKQLTPADVEKGVGDSDPDVKRFAVLLSEPFLSESEDLLTSITGLADHDSMRLRRQVALALGGVTDDRANQALARLLSRRESSNLVRSAALNSVNATTVGPILRTLSNAAEDEVHAGTFRTLLVIAARTANVETVREVLTEYLPATRQSLTLQIADAWMPVLNALDARAANARFANAEIAAKDVVQLFLNARAVLDKPNATENECRAAFRILGRPFGPFSTKVTADKAQAAEFSAAARAENLASFVSPKYSESLQNAAIHAVLGTGSPQAAVILVDAYPSLSPELRNLLTGSLLESIDHQAALLTAIRSNVIRSDSLDAAQREKLLSSPKQDIRKTAEQVFDSKTASSRSEVVTSMKAALHLPGSADRGRQVFRKRCSTCHRLEENGHVVGPDLQALTNRDPMWLLTTILDPNKDVDARYLSWTVVTNDGRTASGMIVSESDTEIVLRESGGKQHQIQRHEIDEFRSSQKSVMPEGLERDLTVQNLSDIIAYLGEFSAPPKSFPGNKPQLISPGADGVLKLTAAMAEIRGTDIRFEGPFSNIGYWHHDTDSATWKINVPKAGDFDVYVNASCSGQAAGNTFRISGLNATITGKVTSTGGWDRYRQPKVGTTTLTAGTHVITVTGTATADRALFDLKEVRLVPKDKAPGFVVADVTDSPLPRYPPEIAPFLLDEIQSVERRQQAIDQRPGMGPGIISLLTSDLKPGDLTEEYRRMPWIWRVAITVAKRNDGGEIRDVLEIAVPKTGQPLRDWQAVVIGGGLINGATQVGVWPGNRLDEILNGLPVVKAAWPDALKKSAAMADNESVKSGTRYDALRMVALQREEVAVPHLLEYLQPDTSRELQMGAVSGLADIQSESATKAIAVAFSFLKGRNRHLAIEGMLRTDQRVEKLADLVRSGKMEFTEKETAVFREHELDQLRRNFRTLLLETDMEK